MRHAVETSVMLGCLLALAAGSQGLSAGKVEHVTDGAFQNGLVDMEIDRYPRYPGKSSQPFRMPERYCGCIKRSLLPAPAGLQEGGYRLSLSPMPQSVAYDALTEMLEMHVTSIVGGW